MVKVVGMWLWPHRPESLGRPVAVLLPNLTLVVSHERDNSGFRAAGRWRELTSMDLRIPWEAASGQSRVRSRKNRPRDRGASDGQIPSLGLVTVTE